MKIFPVRDYSRVLEMQRLTEPVYLLDHLTEFRADRTNQYLDHLNNISQGKNTVYTCYVFDDSVKQHYPNLDLKYRSTIMSRFTDYKTPPPVDYKNFICSFNGSAHTSRKLLASILEKFGYFNPAYSSKNFTYSVDMLDGHIRDYTDTRADFYRTFFISNDSEDFFQTVNSFGHLRHEHDKNIFNLESRLTESFLHIVSETLATSYYPFVTEKFLYSIVTRGLFVTYAQPRWHAHVEKYYGFRLYTKLFDYRFDTIENPVERLVELATMVSKFSNLSPAEWAELYLIEQDTVEYNYNHYYSGRYIEHLRQHNV